jgi:CzcA family heavy metal efflux pump
MMIGLSSKKLSLIDLSVLARWTLRPRLMGVPGVANVAVWGMRDRQLQVQADPERLRAHGLSVDELVKSTGDSLLFSPLTYLNASYPGSGGWIDTPQQRLGVRHIMPVTKPDELARVTVKVDDGVPLRLTDVGQVVEGYLPLIGDALVGDQPGLLLVIEKFPGANTLEVTRALDAALDAMRPGLVGVEIDSSVFRGASFIELSFATLSTALLAGAVLLVVALGAFLANWRAALISVVAIPLSLAAAALMLYLYGTTLNVMVVAGLMIALAAIVDDAVVYVDNVVRRLRQHRQAGGAKSTADIILEASAEIRSPIVFATLIMVLATAPVFFMGGPSGALFQPLAVSYLLALLASTAVALTVTPVLCLLLLNKAPRERRESPLVQALQRRFDAALAPVLGAPRRAAVATAVLALAGLAAWPFLGQELVPAFKERDIMVRWEGAPGTSHPEMARILTRASRELRSLPGVSNVSGHVGRAVLGDQIVGINAGQLWINVSPHADYAATVAAIQQVVDGYPGLVREVQTYLKDRTREALTGASYPIVVRIYGPELDVLRSKAAEVRQLLAGISGLVDLHTELQVDEPHVAVTVDLARVGNYGAIPGDVRRAAATLVAGLGVGNLFEQAKVFDVMVWGTPETRHNPDSIRELLIPTPGGHVRLADMADVRITSTPTVVKHENFSRRIDVLANVRGRDVGSVARDVERRLRQVAYPIEYHSEVLGEYTEWQAARTRMLGVAVGAAIGIFFLLQAALGSWRLAALTVLVLPVALVGGVVAAVLAGGVISLGSLVGFLAVLAIAARSGVLLIHHYQHLERQEGEAFGPGLVLRATRERLGPIATTTVAIAVALLPLVFFGAKAGLEIIQPTAVVILGGLVTSTLITLFVVPALYLGFGSSREPELGLGSSPAPELK